MSFKDSNTSDFVSGQVWGLSGAKIFLLDRLNERLSFSASCAAMRTMSSKWPLTIAKYVEDAANGPAIIDALQRDVPASSFPNPFSYEQRLDGFQHFRALSVQCGDFVHNRLRAAVGQSVNSYKDQDVRRILAPLAQVAEETGAAIVFTRHFRKGGGAAEDAGGGSVGIGAACRSVLRVDKDPENPERLLLSSVKSSVSKKPPTL